MSEKELAEWLDVDQDYVSRVQLVITRVWTGMSQKELAEKLGLAQSYVSRVERGAENLTLSTCERSRGCRGVHLFE